MKEGLTMTDKICLQVGVRISVIMRDKDISCKELSERTGIDSGDISRYRSGKIMATLLTLDKIASGLEVRTVDLFEE